MRIAHEIIERNPQQPAAGSSEIPGLPALIGIQRRGAVLAKRLQSALEQITGVTIQRGELDISFYRDDLLRQPLSPTVHSSSIEFSIDDSQIILVDDVLYTGRTVRAALEAIFAYGRPTKIQLAVLVDRGHRELPIRPDYVGKNLPTAADERVRVQVTEIDGEDAVSIVKQGEGL